MPTAVVAPFHHLPVLLDEVLHHLAVRPGDIVVDATVGGAGHAYPLAQRAAPGGRLLCIDRDPDAMVAAQSRLSDAPVPCAFALGSFAEIDTHLRAMGMRPTTEQGGGVDVILADLGLSSHQLDQGSRGFSLSQDGPLDMRMSQRGESAADYVQRVSPRDLARALSEGGDVSRPGRVAAALKEQAAQGQMTRTIELRSLCERLFGRPRPGKIHPATTVFQALRIAVNDELGALEQLLSVAPQWLRPGGRLGIISFHSGEDRRVKHTFRAWASPCTCPPRLPLCACGLQPLGIIQPRKAVVASEGECQRNPRARSARLRVFVFNQVD